MKLSHKIYGVIATLLIMMMAIAGFSINSMNTAGASLVDITQEDIPLSNVVTEITVKQLEQALWLERAIGAAELNKATRLAESQHEFERLNHLLKEDFVKAILIAEHGVASTQNDAARPEFASVESVLHEIESSHATYSLHAEELLEALNAGRVAGNERAIANIEAEQEALDRRLGSVLLEIETFTAAAATKVEHAGQSALIVLVGLAIAALVVGSGIAMYLTRSIVGPIHSAVIIMERMSEGDMTNVIEVKSSDEIGQLSIQMGDMQTKLTDIVSRIQGASEAVKTGADEIAQGNADLSQRSEEQASSLEETAASMEEMTSTVKQNADNAGEANQLAIAAREQAGQGGSVVSQAVQAMEDINASSKKISDIIGVIDEIAFQTNLLALNASVEAARAGDQGRGFAVVASEVRNLAGRSATAAKEIKDLIEDSGRKVEDGSRLVNESGEALQGIEVSIKKVTDIVGEIAAASQEQSDGIEQVNKAILQMDELTQQNAALVEEAAAASESLGDQADDLNQQMQFFTIASDDGSGSMAAVSAKSQPGAQLERRSSSRPWSGAAPSEHETAPEAPARQAVANGGDQEWEEF